MAKYDPLRDYLRQQDGTVALTFVRIDTLVGGLPRSAGEYREWWANDEYHVQAAAWRDAGFKVESVDLSACRVRFSKLH